jgi:hypothetical protein
MNDAGELALPIVFNTAAQADAMWAVLLPQLARGMLTGAANVVADVEAHKVKAKSGKKELDSELLKQFTLPESIKHQISQALVDLSKQPYWKAIQQGRKTLVTKLLEAGIAEGLSGKALAKKLRSTFGDMSKPQAANIARTESTMAFGRGHAEAIREFGKSGDVVGKRWLNIDDEDSRDTHSVDQTVGPDEKFNIGGHECDYPGDPALPAEERCGCRCTVVSTFSEELTA